MQYNGLRRYYRDITVCSRLEQSGRPPCTGWLGAIRQARPGGGGAAALAGFEVYPPTPLPTYQGGVAEKVGAGFQQGVYKITPILQTPLSNIAIYDNYTGGARKIRGHLEGMGPQGEIEIGLCGRHTRRVQVPEARSSSWVFYLLSSGGKGRQPLPPSNRPAGAKPGSIPGRAANPERGISNRKEVNSLLRCFLSHGLVTHCLVCSFELPGARAKPGKTRDMARGFRAIYAESQKGPHYPRVSGRA